MKIVTKIEMDYNELDQLIENEFGMQPGTYESVAQNEWNNYSSYTFTVEPKELSVENISAMTQAAVATKFKPEGLSELESRYYRHPTFRCPNYDCCTRDLLNHLCATGVITAGDYLIEVSW